MKKNSFIYTLSVLLATCFFTFPAFALDYNINFTASGASNNVETVVVQNLTRGNLVVVPAGHVLNLTDQTTGNLNLDVDGHSLKIYPASEQGEYLATFNAKNGGNVVLSVYSIDGRKIHDTKSDIAAGQNTFKLSLQKGLFIVKVNGDGFTYSAKVVNNIQRNSDTKIVFNSTEKTETATVKKIGELSVVVKLTYLSGDLLLYKANSGEYSTIMTDIPNASKTVNFNFVACKDASGNNYAVVKVGSQLWMAENLKTSKFRTGDDIVNLTNSSDWSMFPIAAWSNYDNNVSLGNTYGKLYNWYAVSDSRNIAPVGWHVPTDDEWTLLSNELGGTNLAGNKLKESGVLRWNSPNTGASNESGFTAIAAGNRGSGNGTFAEMGTGAFWWTATPQTDYYVYFRSVGYNSSGVGRSGSAKVNGLSVRCVKDPELPQVTTISPTNITYTTAVSGGNIISDGGGAILAKGVCWSKNNNPTTADNKTVEPLTANQFASTITGLDINTKYYARAYATNSTGTTYGELIEFNSLQYDTTITDIDGNIYHSITIGNQHWLVENLKTTKYRNGDPIGTTDYLYTGLTYATEPKYQWAYEGNEANVPVYGRLYTWHAVADSRNIAPEGWHVASESELTTLQNYLIANGYNYDKTTTGNKIAKSMCTTTLWNTSSVTGSASSEMFKNNSSGFSMVPNGYRGHDGDFYIMGIGSNTWTSTSVSSGLAVSYGCGYNVPDLGKNQLNKNYGFAVRCIKNSLATITTSEPSLIMASYAECGGDVVADGGETVTEYGLCWSLTDSPTIADSVKIVGAGSGSFKTTLSNLIADTTYYVRAYAKNALGVSYGSQITFKTLLVDPEIVTDADGNLYHTVKIGNQTWMVENLKTTKYNDGTAIPNVTGGYEWISLATPAYCWANNDIQNKAVYGALYNHYAVSTGKLAPAGWHVPTESDWITLAIHLGGLSVSGSALKETGTNHWNYPNSDATNSAGFLALPAGYRTTSNGNFINMGTWSCFWSSTVSNGKAWRAILTNVNGVFDYMPDGLGYGFSVRCIKD